MPKKSNVELEGLLTRAIDLYENAGYTIKNLAELFRLEGFSVSASGIQRALKAHKLSKKDFEKKLKETEIFIEATKNTPGLQMAKAATDMSMAMLITELQGMENLSTLSDGEILDKVSRITRAQRDIAQLTLDYEKGYKAGLFKMQELVNKIDGASGTAAEKLELIKKDLLGLS